ncbi:heterokaryon incompatibility protein-domain-containing protein [Phyllosticta capitalensis]
MVVGNECSLGTRYITLSHCWGPKSSQEKLMLLKGTFQNFRNDQPVAILPKTFRDAMKIIERLRVQYLWIDRLCIIQDSMEDWAQECATMGDVYRHSFLNISAHGAYDDQDGCFFSRNQQLQIPQVNLDPEDSDQSVPYVYFNPGGFHNLWKDDFDKGSIVQRGWILQERLLAPRVIHFGKDQLFWECNESMSSERFPVDLYDFLGHKSRRTVPHLGKALLNSAVRPSDASDHADYAFPCKGLFTDWVEIVENYSTARLSFPSNKLIALSGLANDMQRRLQKEIRSGLCPSNFDAYLAGIWRATLPWGLDWELLERPQARPKYRAPSWSWASVDGKFKYNKFFTRHLGESSCFVSVEQAETVPMRSNTGEVLDGILVLTAPIAVAQLEPPKSPKESLELRAQIVELQSPHDPEISFQGKERRDHIYSAVVFDTMRSEVDRLFCLPVRYDLADGPPRHTDISGIVLESVGEKFRRTGHFQVLLLPSLDIMGFFEKLPRRTVEII